MKALFTYRVCFFFGVILLLNNVTIGQQLPIFSQYLLNDYAYNPAVAGSKDYYDGIVKKIEYK